MRRRTDLQATRKGIHIAFLLDELYHFRNICSHIQSVLLKKTDTRKATVPQRNEGNNDTNHKIQSHPFLTSVLVLTIATGLLAADVFVVYLTQPRTVFSTKSQYNLRATQPAFTDQGFTRYVRRLSRDRPCLTPVFVNAVQKREYTLSVCVISDIVENHGNTGVYVGPLSISSWFHRGGSDHEVKFGTSRLYFRQNAMVYASGAETRRLLFKTVDPDLTLTRFLHELVIYNILEVSCTEKQSLLTCAQIVGKLIKLGQEDIESEVEVWRARKGARLERVRGVRSRYNVTLVIPWKSVDNGVSPLTSTAVVEEVHGDGWYSNITSEEEHTNINGLISEEVRVAGLVALVFLFLVFCCVVLVVRLVLRPLSLGGIAWAVTEHDSMIGHGTDSVAEAIELELAEARNAECKDGRGDVGG